MNLKCLTKATTFSILFTGLQEVSMKDQSIQTEPGKQPVDFL